MVWWNYMVFNIQRTEFISFRRKSNSIHFNYDVSGITILRAGCIKDLGVMLHSKLHFHCRLDYVHSQALRTLGLIPYNHIRTPYNFSILDCLVALYYDRV
jgi:hypothetical protein